jgi:hypothetical protein
MGKLKKIDSNHKNLKSVLVPYGSDGWSTVSGSTLRFTSAQRVANNGRAFSNLYSSFGMPAISGDVTSYLSTWSNTGFSGLAQNNVVVCDISGSTYGELIDGRTIKITIPTISGGVYTLFSSYYEPEPFASDNSLQGEYFGSPKIAGNATGRPGVGSTNIAFLFNDFIKKPTLASSNTSISSWSDGWQSSITPVGYDGGGTDNFRFVDVVTSSNTPKAYAVTQDTPVGIAYLDKGFLVITDQTLVNNIRLTAGTTNGATVAQDVWSAATACTQVYFTASTSATCEFYTFEKQFELTLTLQADSNEFYVTENQTAASSSAPFYGAGGDDTGMQFVSNFGETYKIWDLSDTSSAFITEIGLYDQSGMLVAVAKPDRPIEKPKETPVTLLCKLRY